MGFIGCDSEYESSEVVIFGAGFDGTTSFRPGTRFAPERIRCESFGLEVYSPYQNKELTDKEICDLGDLELCFGNTERVLNDIQEQTEKIVKDGKIPFMIGGEHLVTLGAVRAVSERYPDLHIIHFDAHTDLREEYLGEELSHASVIRRCHDILGDGRIFQFGIRSGERYEFEFAKNGHTFLHPFDLNFDVLQEICDRLEGKPIYFTLDLDVLDPSVFCGTGTLEPGGASFEELRRASTYLCEKLNIVGCDVNELSPHYDQSGASTAVACKIIREILIAI